MKWLPLSDVSPAESWVWFEETAALSSHILTFQEKHRRKKTERGAGVVAQWVKPLVTMPASPLECWFYSWMLCF